MKRWALVLAVVALGACSSDSKSAETTAKVQTSSEATTAVLRPAADVTAGRIAEAAVDLGTTVRVGDLDVTVKTIAAANREGPFMLVGVHLANATKADVALPLFAVTCRGSLEDGGFLTGATVPDSIPAGSFVDGAVNLLMPGDGRYGKPIPTCTAPAYVTAQLNDGSTSPTPAVWKVPDDIVNALNTTATAFNGTLPPYQS